ncbi:FMN-binding protein [Candidatus Saccharibacteria bacterium]|nr:FMN-binding protein [Candidatus Saccharibacteria bacterium]
MESNQQQYKNRSRQVTLSAAIIVIIALVIAGVLANSNKPAQQSSTETQQTTSSTPGVTKTAEPTGEAAAVPNGPYKGGTYRAQGVYTSPGGETRINITLTIDGSGKVVNTKAESASDNPTSRRYQTKFIRNYTELVVGKNVNEIKLTTVSGSSLTSRGFQDALQKIKTEAKA